MRVSPLVVPLLVSLGGPSPAPASTPQEPLNEIVVEAQEPRFVAPTRRDRIGRIWAPVLINGKGPFRLVLDTGASRSAVIPRVAENLGLPAQASSSIRVRGFTGTAVVPAIQIERMEVGDLLIHSTVLPIIADVFGGAEGVLGSEGLMDKRIFIDFARDRIVISRSHRERARFGFRAIPLKLTQMGLLVADVRVGSIRAKAIIDTGAQRTVGNLALRNALMRRPARNPTVEDIVGVTLDMQRGERIATPLITFGDFAVQGAHMTFGDMFLFEHWKLTRQPTVLIGMDVLGLLETLIIDYKMRELQIRIR
jgi:predicted aspartyl protease